MAVGTPLPERPLQQCHLWGVQKLPAGLTWTGFITPYVGQSRLVSQNYRIS